jgi:hypothetical protein
MAAPGFFPVLPDEVHSPSSVSTVSPSSELTPLLDGDAYFLPATTYGEDHRLLGAAVSNSSSPSSIRAVVGGSSPPVYPSSPPLRPEHDEQHVYIPAPTTPEPSEPSPASSDYESSTSQLGDTAAGVLDMRDLLSRLLADLAIKLGDEAHILEEDVSDAIAWHFDRLPPTGHVALAVFAQNVFQTLRRQRTSSLFSPPRSAADCLEDYPRRSSWNDLGIWPLERQPFVRKHRLKEVLESGDVCQEFLAFLEAEHDESIAWYTRVSESQFP